MQFRKWIITSFIAGSALLLPDLAFAEKSPDSTKRDLTAASVQDNLPVSSEKDIGSYKAPTESPAESVDRSQPTVQIKPVIEKPVQAKPVIKPLQSEKPASKPSLNVNKSEKAAKVLSPNKATGEKQGLSKNIDRRSGKTIKKAAVKPIHNVSEYAKDTERHSPGLKVKVEPSQENAEKQVPEKKPAPQKNIQSIPLKRDEPGSSQKERYPKGDNLPNPPSRTKTSGGSSSDRTSNGNTSTSFNDKWFIWEQSYNLILIQPYSSRAAVYHSQWVNAPPSPPPIKAPVFLPYTDAISHG